MHQAELLFYGGFSDYQLGKLSNAFATLQVAFDMNTDRNDINDWLKKLKREILERDFDKIIGRK